MAKRAKQLTAAEWWNEQPIKKREQIVMSAFPCGCPFVFVVQQSQFPFWKLHGEIKVAVYDNPEFRGQK